MKRLHEFVCAVTMYFVSELVFIMELYYMHSMVTCLHIKYM